MEHLLVSLAEFLLLVGVIGIALVVLLLLGLGGAAWGVARMFSRASWRDRKLSEIEVLRLRLQDAQNTAYESAMASEKTIQQLQQRLSALESERPPSSVLIRR